MQNMISPLIANWLQTNDRLFFPWVSKLFYLIFTHKKTSDHMMVHTARVASHHKCVKNDKQPTGHLLVDLYSSNKWKSQCSCVCHYGRRLVTFVVNHVWFNCTVDCTHNPSLQHKIVIDEFIRLNFSINKLVFANKQTLSNMYGISNF